MPPWRHALQRWPLPAVAAWLAAWALFAGTRPLLGAAAAALLGGALGVAAALRQPTRARRLWVAAGFPMSLLAAGAPPWAWAGAAIALAAAYPMRTWGDAPLFPTPRGALAALAPRLPLPGGARVLDAGCGLGHGLRALREAWPHAAVEGVEWSLPLAWAARWRCRFARVSRGDMWRPGAWRGLQLVYLFQRPESMARAWDKACAEMPGGWLVSLEFAVPGRTPDLTAALGGGRAVMAWRVPAQPGAGRADITG